GWIGRLAKQEHRRDAPLKKTTRHIAQQETAESLMVKATQHINLVQFAHESRHSAVVRRAFGKADQRAGFVLDDHAKPASVLYLERLSPLTLPEFEGGSAAAPAPVRFIKRLDVQSCQGLHVVFACISDVKCHGAC